MRKDQNPQAWLGKGTAWLVFDAKRNSYQCYWQVGPADDHVVEHAIVASAEAAVEWAETRTPRARIRLPDHQTYWAGTDPSPEGYAGIWAPGPAQAATTLPLPSGPEVLAQTA
jgi:hypothetical protein